MQETVRDLLSRRKNRAIAIILSAKDEYDEFLPDEASHKIRKVVLDQVNEFHDMCVDIIEAVDTGTVLVNEHFLQKLEDIHAYIESLPDDDDV